MDLRGSSQLSSYKETGFLENSIKEFGTSTIIAAIDIKKFFGRYKIYTNGGRDLVKFDLANYLIRLNNIGVSGNYYYSYYK